MLDQDCTKRNCIYETWCITCWEEDVAKVEEKYKEDEKMMKVMMKRIKVYKYTGETSRSVYERIWEHNHSMEQLHTSSHMLKHVLEVHGEEEYSKVEFGAKVVRYEISAFNRQVTESVIIQEERSHHILNSKSEYNRCSLPRLTAKLGEKEWKRKEKENESEKEREQRLERRIVEMRKTRNGRRRREATENEQEKRKCMENKDQERTPKRRKTDIRNYLQEKNTNENEKEVEEETREEKSTEEETRPQEEKETDVVYGEWESGEWMEAGFWDKYIAERQERILPMLQL